MTTYTRLRLLAQTAAIRWIDPHFVQRHPGRNLRRLIDTLAPAVRCLQPNDRWSLGVFVDEWVRLLDEPPLEPLPPGKRIFMFSCYRGQFTHDLVMALLLAWRGHTITFGYLPKLQSPIKDPLDDHPSATGYLEAVFARVTKRSGGRVHCIDLSQTAIEDAACDEAFLAAQLNANIVMRVRQETYDPADPQVVFAHRHYSRLGRQAQQLARAWLGRHREAIDLCLIPNGASFENAQFCHAAKALDIPVNTFEKFAFSKVRTITHGDAFFNFFDLDRIWSRRRELGFLDEPKRSIVRKQAWDLLDQRRNSAGNAWDWQYQKATRSHSEDELQRRFAIERGRFVLICPNVPFDAGYEGWLGLFTSMRGWLVETVEHLLAHQDLPIVIRAHPAETRPGFGREKLATILADAGLASDRLVVLPGDSDINTYDLMPLCRFAAVFASTTGVEIAMHGKPVIAGANVYSARCRITEPTPDRDAYFKRLSALATGPAIDDHENAEAAALLYFLFHYVLQWPYPYDKPSQITAMPLRRMPRHEFAETWCETLDVLTMTEQEFETALPRLTAMDRIAARWNWQEAGVA